MQNKGKQFIDLILNRAVLLLVLGLISGFIMLGAFTFKWIFGVK